MAQETLIIETPERVELQFALASLGNRFFACAIDHGIQLLFIVIVFIVSQSLSAAVRSFNQQAFNRATSGDLWTIALGIACVFLIIFGYFTFFEAAWNGQTPGKRILRLRVIKDDGRPLNAFEAFSRNLLRMVDSFPTPYYSVGIFTVFASARSQRLGDFVAGTVVIKERSSEAPSFEDVFVAEELEDRGFDIARRRVAPPLKFKGDIRIVTGTEIEVVEAFLRRRYDLPQLPRQWMAWRVAMPLLESIHPLFERKGFSYEGFLEELVARYRRTGA